jgi:hypothetical protein
MTARFSARTIVVAVGLTLVFLSGPLAKPRRQSEAAPLGGQSGQVCGKPFLSTQTTQPRHKDHAYHQDPPQGLPAATLDPEQFSDNKAAFVVYSLATKIREVLYQVPCYCGCDRTEKHQSLLECYQTKHGVGCPACQKGAIVTYELTKAGKTPAEIRSAMALGDIWRFDIKTYVAEHYSEYKQSPRKTNPSLHRPGDRP